MRAGAGTAARRRAGRVLVDADLLVARLEQLLVERIDELVVVHPPRVLAAVFVGIVADRIALERVWLEAAEPVIDLFEPARLARGEDRAAQPAARARALVHPRA